MTALAPPDFVCACGKRWVAAVTVEGVPHWQPMDAATTACATCLATAPPKRRKSGLRVVGRMRDRENESRAGRGEPIMRDVSFVDAVKNGIALVNRAIDGKRTPKEPDTIDAHAEPVEDDETHGGAHRRLVSGK